MQKKSRKIRQKLITKKKFNKYFIWSVFEILFVVIGILIAFQIDNWNERRKTDLLEIRLLKEIRNGLVSDLNDVNVNLAWHSAIYENQNSIIEWLESELDYSDSLTHTLSNSLKGSFILISEGPYESLKQFGVNQIQNGTLRKLIIDLYEIGFPSYSTIYQIYKEQLIMVLTQGANHFTEYSLIVEEDVVKPIDIVQLKNDNKFLYHLKSLKNINKLAINQTHEMKIKLEETIEALNEELERRQ